MTSTLLRDLIGLELREIRTSRNISLRQLAAASAVSYSFISELERGQKEASSEILASICRSLEVPMSSVLLNVSEKLARPESSSRLVDKWLTLPESRSMID